MNELKTFGKTLIIAGTLGFLAAVVLSFTALSGLDQGALPAASFLSIMLGIAFAYPSLLQDTQGGLSTMRIVVFAVVLLFCTIYLKIGWTITKLETLTIDQRWIYILGLAFGSKAFQRFGEKEEDDTTSMREEKTIIQKETTVAGAGAAAKGKDTSGDVAQ
jgi:hypothetical protein